jgi:TM2 domain-containing membrane protein YozV
MEWFQLGIILQNLLVSRIREEQEEREDSRKINHSFFTEYNLEERAIKRKTLGTTSILFTLSGFLGTHRFYLGGSYIYLGTLICLCATGICTSWAAFYPGYVNHVIPLTITIILAVIGGLLYLRDLFMLKKMVQDHNLKVEALVENEKQRLAKKEQQEGDWRVVEPHLVRVGRIIGTGRTTIVHIGSWSYSEEPVALKKVLADIDPATKRMLIREAELHAKLVHENIIKCYGVCEDPLCLIMELMERGYLL